MKTYYQKMLLSILDVILTRSAKSESGGFINTKLSLFTGDDFANDDPIKGISTIFSWIQGRGLEALAVHYKWLQRDNSIPAETRDRLSQDCLKQLAITLDSMEKLRQMNSGRLSFMHSANSSMPLNIDSEGNVVEVKLNPAGPSTMSELFYVKGLAAAADVLGDAERLQTACRCYDVIHKDIITNRFINDQVPLDPKNVAAKPVQGRLSHGPRMIALGAAFRFLELTGDKKYLLYGLEYLDYILANHVNIVQQPNCPGEMYDMWEFTHENLEPYYDADGRLFSDPGHATEFTGLAGKLLLIAEQKGLRCHIDRLAEYKTLLPAILQKNFNNGFSGNGFGICKAVDLISKKSINADIPWWPLPETMRSACIAMNYGEPTILATCHEILKKCSDTFVNFFVRKDLHMMAYQTLDVSGKPINVIPATPDADPGYHTNMSIIDCLSCLEASEIQ